MSVQAKKMPIFIKDAYDQFLNLPKKKLVQSSQDLPSGIKVKIEYQPKAKFIKQHQ
jgi:hypothetical protein